MAHDIDAAGQLSRAPGLDLGPLPGWVGYALRRAQLAVFDDFIRTLDSVGLRPASFSALVVISRNPGLNQSEVSAALGIQRTNFVTMVDELERRGLAERRPSETDRRSHALHLTGEGERLLRRAMELQEDHERRLTDRLGPGGREQLLGLLAAIVDEDSDRG